MTELERILKPLMEIADDETFCVEEYEAFTGVTADDWQEIEARGYDKESILDSYFRYCSKEKKLDMAKQIWDELADIPTVEAEYDLLIDTDFRCWNKGSTIFDIWHDIENWFDVSIAVDLMNM